MIEKTIVARHKANEMSQPLATIPGVGIVTATAMVATVVDAGFLKSGRHFAAWLGLVPQQNGTGGTTVLGKISKKGEPFYDGCSFWAPRRWHATCATSRIWPDG